MTLFYLPVRVTPFLVAVAVMLLSVHGPLLAAPIVDPSLQTVIDPSGGDDVDIDAVNAVTAIADLQVIQNWDGWVQNDAKGAGQYIAFTSPTQPDLRFTDGGVAGSSHMATQGGQGTSNTSSTADSIRFRSHSSQPVNTAVSMTIQIGDYDTDTGVFSALSEGVRSLAFTMSDLTSVQSLSVVFYDGATVLSTQTAAGGYADVAETDAIDVYFGYTAEASQSIDRVVITRILTAAQVSPDTAPSVYFDDLGFTTLVPEPGSLCLGLLAFSLVVRRRAISR